MSVTNAVNARHGLIPLVVLALALVTIPYLVAMLNVPPNSQFSGALINRMDINSHLGKMQQAGRGSWLWDLRNNAEPTGHALIQTSYFALGHIVRLTGLDPVLVYHAARICFTAWMLVALFGYVRRALPSVRAWVGTGLAIFGSGLGLLLYALDPVGAAQIAPIELWLSDAYPLAGALTFPHFALSLALLFHASELLIVLLVEADQTVPLVRFARLKLALILLPLAVTNPFSVAVIALVAFIIAGWRLLRSRNLPELRHALGVGLALTPGLLLIGYTLIQFTLPFWREFTAQNVTLSPPVQYYLFGFAPLLLPAVVGVILALRRMAQGDSNAPRLLVPILILLVDVMLLYAPTSSQRRFTLGITAPLAILAVYWIAQVGYPLLRRRLRRRARTATLIYGLVATFGTWIVFGTWLMIPFSAGGRETVLASDHAAAFTWIEQNTDWESVFLAPLDPRSDWTANDLGARTGRRVYLGHWIETVDYPTKQDFVNRFYTASAAGEETQIPAQVDYIWYPKRDGQAFTAYSNVVYENNSVVIVRVR